MSNNKRFGWNNDASDNTGGTDAITENPTQPITTGGGSPFNRGITAEIPGGVTADTPDYPSTGGGTPIVKWPSNPE